MRMSHPNIRLMLLSALRLLPARSVDIAVFISALVSRLVSRWPAFAIYWLSCDADGVLTYTTSCGLAHTFFSYLMRVDVNTAGLTVTITMQRASRVVWLKRVVSISDTSNIGSRCGSEGMSCVRTLSTTAAQRLSEATSRTS